MFRALITPIFRSTRLCATTCGIMHPRCCRPVAWKCSNSASRLPAGNIVDVLNALLYQTTQNKWYKFLLIIQSAQHVSVDDLIHLQEHQTVRYSLWYNAPTMLPASGQQRRGCITPQVVAHSLVLLKMGVINARNMLSLLELLINRYCCM